ncbi:MAG: hypothetical protein NDJ75_07625 [Thermoanaerobaculia bacterium]|nr:hypothetical protein [Thermoanaerobaculia bacterium]
MSQPFVPPPPPVDPGAAAPKKGLSTGAKVAIGCLVAVLLVAGGCFVVTAFFVKKGVDAAKGFVADVENDPDAAAVKALELAMRMNPDVEVVSSDPQAGTLTLREKRTGKVVTFSADDLQSGKFSFEADGERVEIDADEGQDGQPGGLRIASDERTMVFGADAEAVPAWVPRYPGARADSFSTLEAPSELSGTFTIHTADPAAQVLAFYQEALEQAGFEVEKTTLQSASAEGGNLTAKSGDRSLNIALAAQEGETQGLVAYAEKRQP